MAASVRNLAAALLLLLCSSVRSGLSIKIASFNMERFAPTNRAAHPSEVVMDAITEVRTLYVLASVYKLKSEYTLHWKIVRRNDLVLLHGLAETWADRAVQILNR